MTTKKPNQTKKDEKLTKKQITEDPRLNEIAQAIEKLTKICNEKEPKASIICSVCLPGTESDLTLTTYVGDTPTQIFQLQQLTENNKQFLNDLKLFLQLRIKRSMELMGTTGSPLADELLKELDGTEKPN